MLPPAAESHPMSSALEQAAVRTGTWLYDGTVKRPVRVLRLSRDYWFDLAQADGRLEKHEAARLNEHGFLYYVRFGEDGESPFPMSKGFESCEEAMRWAEKKVSSPIAWDGDTPWESAQRTHEGFPLYLRRPAGLEFDALMPRYPALMALSHHLSSVRPDGAPEPTYNRGLEDFDAAVTSFFLRSHEGQIVLVETFGGKRHYYFYVSPSVVADDVLGELRARFPGHRLEVETRSDPAWDFIRRYTKEIIGEG
jgi:hypothetical protein